MIRDTSIQAYYTIRDKGLLPERRFQVYTIIFNHGPITQNETQAEYFKSHRSTNSGTITTRFSELERMGVIESIGTRECKISGYDALVYIVTSNLPKKLPKPVSRRKIISEVMNKLTEIRKNTLTIQPLQLNNEMYEVTELIKKLL